MFLNSDEAFGDSQNIEPYVPREVHVFQMKCEKCDWTSLVAHDASGLNGLAAQLEASPLVVIYTTTACACIRLPGVNAPHSLAHVPRVLSKAWSSKKGRKLLCVSV